MSELDTIKSKPKAKRILKGIHFDFSAAEVSYTDASQGGAASLMNEPFLLKANETIKPLSKEQQEILDAIGEESKPLLKAGKPDSTSSNVERTVEDDNKTKGDISMSEEVVKDLQEQMVALQKELDISKAEKSISGYGLEDEVGLGLAKALSDLDEDGVAAVHKAIETILSKAEKALTEKEEEVNKAAEDAKTEDNPLAKALEEEEGHQEKQEVVAKSMVEQLNEIENKDAK